MSLLPKKDANSGFGLELRGEEKKARRMKITFVLPGYPWRPIGAFRVVYEYANQLVARGHDVTLVHARRVKYEEEFWAPRGLYRRLRRTAGRLRDVTFTPAMSWAKLDERVRTLFVPEPTATNVPDADAVIAGAWGAAPYILWYPERKGERFHLIQHYAATFGLPEAWVQTVWQAPFHNIVVSRWLGEIASQMGIRDVTVAPNGINENLFRVTHPIEQRPRKIAMLFSLAEWKGSADGIKAIETAKAAYPDLQCVLFGTSPRRPEIPAWIEYHRDPKQETLVSKIYNSSSTFLCPSWLEGFALPPLEAMACGCAVVTTDCGGNRDYAENGINALVSPARNPEHLAQNLLRVLDDDALRLRLARAGIERAREFTWGRSTDKLESVLATHVAVVSAEEPCAGLAAPPERKPNHAEL
jgi:glycosyltransferase involved in cell wall biosynthesis